MMTPRDRSAALASPWLRLPAPSHAAEGLGNGCHPRGVMRSGERPGHRRSGEGRGATAVEVAEGPPVVAERSPADLLRLGVAAAGLVIVLLLQWLTGDAVVDQAPDPLRGLDSLPSSVGPAIV